MISHTSTSLSLSKDVPERPSRNREGEAPAEPCVPERPGSAGASPSQLPSFETAPEMEQLQARVQSQLIGRVQHFRLMVRGYGLILRGHTHTYYAKQLAQHAVMEATTLPILANEIEVS